FGWPSLLGGYQLDDQMEPVLFWSEQDDPNTLGERIVSRLRRIDDERRRFLNDETKALNYFIEFGSGRQKVFISNYNEQNALARELAASLRSQAIDVFHYKDPDRDPARPNWKDEVRGQIDIATAFVALIGPRYAESEWCQWETDVAIERFKAG